jgi:hypothetical protein
VVFLSALLIGLLHVADPGPFDAIERGAGIRVEIAAQDFTDAGRGYKVTGKAPRGEDLEKYRPILIAEWSLYPASLMKRAQVAKMVVCSGLALNGQIRAAAPAFDLSTMYYDAALGAAKPPYQKRVIHHEFFHMLDQRMGKLYVDPEWAALNPSGFRYGPGGKNMRTSGVGELTDSIAGFLTPYGTAGVEEDKAELYCHMIVDSEFVRGRAAKDPILATKIGLLRQRLRAFEATFDDAFWAKFGWPPTLGPGGGTRHDTGVPWLPGHRLAIPAR